MSLPRDDYGPHPASQAVQGIDRTPPQNVELEMSVLGGIMLEPKEAFPLVADILNRDSFYLEGHGLIFDTMASLHAQGIPPDSVAVLDRLRATEKLQHVGGSGVVLGMLNSVPTAANVEYHAKKVAEKAYLRQLIRSCTRVIQDCHRQDLPLEEILDRAEASILALSQTSRGADSPVPIGEILRGYLDEVSERVDEIERRDAAGEKDFSVAPGYSTGFVNLDQFAMRLRPSELTIVAARPSQGKSALGLNMAYNLAVKQQIPVLVFSLEMAQKMVAERMLSSGTRHTRGDGGWMGVTTVMLQDPRLTDQEWNLLQGAYEQLSAAPIFVLDRPHIRPGELRSISANLMRQTGGKLVVILDYLQLLTAQNETGNLYTDTTSNSRDTKRLAQYLRIPVVALSQFSRANEKEKRRPQLSDLRDSGAIEQDADNVLFIHHPDTGPLVGNALPSVELIIAKHRNGPTGTAHMLWHKQLTRFLDAAPGYRPAEQPRALPPRGQTPVITRTSGNPNEQ